MRETEPSKNTDEEAREVERILITRDGQSSMIASVDAVLPDGAIFHVLTHTPEQTADLFIVLVDGETVIQFELPRSSGSSAESVAIHSLADYRHQLGQGKFRDLLDAAADDARRRLLAT